MRARASEVPRRNTPKAWLRALGALCCWLLLFAGATTQSAASSQGARALLVITHLGVPEMQLDQDHLRAVFLRRRLLWSDGQHVIPINHPSGDALRVAFDRALLGFDADEVARYWIDARIRSGTQPPRAVMGEGLVARVVAVLRGSIGYVRAGQPIPGVRVIARIEIGRVLPP
jgi:hypothetical protein